MGILLVIVAHSCTVKSLLNKVDHGGTENIKNHGGPLCNTVSSCAPEHLYFKTQNKCKRDFSNNHSLLHNFPAE